MTVIAQECKRVELNHDFGYVAAATWSHGASGLWFADSRRGVLVSVGLDGTVRRKIARPGFGRFEFERPVQLTRAGEGYLLKDVASHLVWFDEDFAPKKALDFRRGARQSDFLGDLYLIDQVVNEQAGTLIGYGFIRAAEESRAWHGFFRLKIGPAGVSLVEKLEEVPSRSLEAAYGAMSLPILASAAGDIWALRLTSPPMIVRQTTSEKRLKAFPIGFDTMPNLPESTPTNGTERFAILERSTVPVGLYGRGDHLYLVTRRHLGHSGTSWELHQIDPREDRVVRSVALPTDAAHVVLAPGEAHWAVLEKESRSSNGQPIPSMLVVSTSLMTDSSAPSDALTKICP